MSSGHLKLSNASAIRKMTEPHNVGAYAAPRTLRANTTYSLRCVIHFIKDRNPEKLVSQKTLSIGLFSCGLNFRDKSFVLELRSKKYRSSTALPFRRTVHNWVMTCIPDTRESHRQIQWDSNRSSSFVDIRQ